MPHNVTTRNLFNGVAAGTVITSMGWELLSLVFSRPY